jgi:hypothetical protein
MHNSLKELHTPSSSSNTHQAVMAPLRCVCVCWPGEIILRVYIVVLLCAQRAIYQQSERASAIVVFCLRFGPAQTASNHFPPFCRSTRRAQAPLLNLCVSQVFTENGSLGKTPCSLFRASLSPAHHRDKNEIHIRLAAPRLGQRLHRYFQTVF